MSTSPNIANYTIAQGIISFLAGAAAPTISSVYRDLGNCPKATLKGNVTTKDHFSSRTGVRTKDVSRVTEKSATIDLELEEFTAENLKLAMAGGAITGTITKTFDYMGETDMIGWIKIVGTNDIGTKVSFLGKVSVSPNGSYDFIGNGDYGSINISLEVLADDDGKMGVITVIEAV